MKRVLLISLLYLIGLSSYQLMAQPGYQGKKNIVKYAALISPAWLNANYSSAPKFFNYNATHTIAYTRVMTRRSMFGVKGSIARTSVPYQLLLGNGNLYQGEVSPIKATAYTAGIEYYIFLRRGGNLAPLGSYFMVESSLMWIRLYDTQYNQSIGYFNKVNAGIWFGQQKIYYNKILFDIGIGSQILFLPTESYGDIVISTYDKLTLKENAESRLFTRNLFNVKIGIGYIF